MTVASLPPAGKIYRAYYFAGAQRVAVRERYPDPMLYGADKVSYLLSDHLGSTSVTYNASTGATVTQLYKPWGEVRYASGTLPTKYTYTGQYSNTADFGLMYYRARWYDPSLGRFSQADTIVPGAGNPMAWDRYAYALNNSLRYSDPSGHGACDGKYQVDECGDIDPDGNGTVPLLLPENTYLTSEELLVLALLLTGESCSGRVPLDITLMKAWVFLNKISFDKGKGWSLYQIWRGLEAALIDTTFDGADWDGLVTRAQSYNASTNGVGEYFDKVLAALPHIVSLWLAKGPGSEFDPTKGAIQFADVPEHYPKDGSQTAGKPITRTNWDDVNSYRQFIIKGHQYRARNIPGYQYVVTVIYPLNWGNVTSYTFTTFRTYIPED